MTLSILIWLPLAISLLAALMPRPLVGRVAAVGSLVTLGIAISFLARFKLGHAGFSSSPTTCGSRPSASITSSGSMG